MDAPGALRRRVGTIDGNRHLDRFAGIGRDGGAAVSWSIVLKRFRPGGRDDLTWLTYWKREILAYQSGLLDDLPGVVAPRAHGVDDFPDGTVGLWLEDIPDAQPGDWPLARFALAARHLGRFSGQYLRDGTTPDRPWLASGYLRRWVASRVHFPEAVAGISNEPLLDRYWTDDLIDGTIRLFEERDSYFDAQERLPRTFVHGDTGRRNLISRRGADGREATVLIDWAYCGIGVVGEDVHQTVVTSAHMFDVAIEDIDELERLVLDRYQEGLGDAGVDIDPRLVRLGYLIPAAVRNTFMPFGTVVPAPEQIALVERSYGRPFEVWVARQVTVRRFMLRRAIEARRLIDVLTVEGLLAPTPTLPRSVI